MTSRARKSSARVTLVLIGLAAVAGCSRDEMKRDVYASKEDCLADWGNKPEDCKPSTDPKHAGRGYFLGPMVAVPGFFGRGMGWSDSSGASRSSRSIGSTSSSSSRSSSSVSRGGFGSSSRSSGG